jgi:hypothetical protein
MWEGFMAGKRFAFVPLLLALVAAQAGLSTGARAGGNYVE